ncbi:Solute carrier family 25 member 39 [Myotis davidii]|uniref:Mitochondrial glutathione transporter SLC25A39 n=1 Tax=Myotis davidii TaxID=225400 RepID=L5LRJ1_MYODS|nr:Solute carrier family 25 member 39 [Myotis davidii]
MADQDTGGISPLQQMVAPGAGAVVTSTFMTPLDVVKVRLQSQLPAVTSELMPPSRLWSLLRQIALLPPTPREVPPVLQWCPGALGPVPKWCPLCHLHSGPHSLQLVMTVPATAIYFTTYDNSRPS